MIPRLLSLCAALFTSAAAAGQALDAAGEKFTAEIARAYAKPDPKQIRALLHPKSAACMRAEPAYERYLMRAETTQPIPSGAKVSVVSIAPEAKLPYAGFEFPLRPSHVVRMEYGRQVSPDGRSAVTQVAEKHVVRDGGRWHLVMPCPTPKGMAVLKEMGLLN